MEPLLLLICLHRKSATYRAITEAKTFGLNILGNDHKDIALLLASRNADKFNSEIIEHAADGTAYVRIRAGYAATNCTD